MELWDAYDENFNIIEGMSLVGGEPIPQGAHHLVVEVLARRLEITKDKEDNIVETKETYLLTLRDPLLPLGAKWQPSACGAARQGEKPLDCAARVLFEQTGLKNGKFTEIGREVSGDVCYVEFIAQVEYTKDPVVLKEGESIDSLWEEKKVILAMQAAVFANDRLFKYLK